MSGPGIVLAVRSKFARALVVAGVSGSLMILAACAEDQPAATASASTSASASATPTPTPSAPAVKPSSNFDKVSVTGKFGDPPKVKVDAPWAIDQTRTKVLRDSDGPAAAPGGSVSVNYYGVNARTGKKFDDSFSTGQPVSFNLAQVVPGFRKGLEGQKQGSRVLIAMPGADGYDSSGGNPQIEVEVGDTLIFVVDLLGVQLSGPQGTAVKPAAGLPAVTDEGGKPKVTIPQGDPPAKLRVQPLIKGTGAKVTEGDTIVMNYHWQTWSGRVLEETYSAQPAQTPVSGLLSGMVKGLVGQPVGSRVLIVIPPGADSYPEGNENPKVEKTDTLVMVVDILFASTG